MEPDRLLSFGILILAVMTLCFAVPARTQEGHFARTLQVSGAVDLEIQTSAGTIGTRQLNAGCESAANMTP